MTMIPMIVFLCMVWCLLGMMVMLMEDKVTEVKKTLVCHEKSR